MPSGGASPEFPGSEGEMVCCIVSPQVCGALRWDPSRSPASAAEAGGAWGPCGCHRGDPGDVSPAAGSTVSPTVSGNVPVTRVVQRWRKSPSRPALPGSQAAPGSRSHLLTQCLQARQAAESTFGRNADVWETKSKSPGQQ